MATTPAIQIRRGTAALWTSANPILFPGEMGLETDTLKFKFGDGTSAWTSLAYASAGGTSVTFPVVKAAVKAATITNVATLSGTTTIDGQALAAGDRVLLAGQSTTGDNGIWVVQSGAWTRPTDWANGSTQYNGTLIPVTSGTLYFGAVFMAYAGLGTSGQDASNTFGVQNGGVLVPTIVAITTTTLRPAGFVQPDVKLVATTNQTLSGFPTIDGVVVAASDRVLLTGQTTQSQNGIYLVNGSGVWSRPFDFTAGFSRWYGTSVRVVSGTLYAGTRWSAQSLTPGNSTATTFVVDTTSHLWAMDAVGTPVTTIPAVSDGGTPSSTYPGTTGSISLASAYDYPALTDNRYAQLLSPTTIVASSGASTAVTWATTAPVWDVTLTSASVALTIPGAGQSGKLATLTLVLRQDATGSRVVYWPSNVTWAGGAPTLSTFPNAYDTFTLVSTDGANWVGIGGAPTVPGQDPITISGCVTALEAWSVDGTDGSVLTAAPDRTGKTVTAVTTWPTYRRSGFNPSVVLPPSLPLGRPYFDMLAAANSGLSVAFGATANTWTIIAAMYAITQGEYTILSPIRADAGTYVLTVKNTGYPYIYDGGTFYNFANPWQASQFSPLVLSLVSTGTATSIFINGGSHTSGGPASQIPITGFKIQNQSGNNVRYSSAYAFNRALSTGERTLVERWAGAHIGVTI